MAQSTYKAADFQLSGLKGISDQTLEMHLGLYEGYVKNTNLLTEQLMEMVQKKKMSATNPAYAELTRRLGFEYGGMVLHEYYFENLIRHGKGEPAAQLKRAFEQCFGGFDRWQAAFVAVGNMRGVGWAVLYQDPVTGQLSNHWVALHHVGAPSGFKPLIVMDMWEHAYLLDYPPAEKSKYIEAFFANLDWSLVNKRWSTAAAARKAAA
jgi:superoxide dismutase, Fe-Mn family